MLLLLYLVVKIEQYIVTSSCRFLDEKTMLEIWLNPGLNLTIFGGTGPWGIKSGFQCLCVFVCHCSTIVAPKKALFALIQFLSSGSGDHI